MTRQIDGATVLVTGASSGIGAALAPLLAERGATVGLVARRADRLAEVVDRCREHAPESRRWVADLDDPDAAARVAEEAWDAFGHLDVVVNNAAVPKRRRVQDLTIAAFKTTDIDLFLAGAAAASDGHLDVWEGLPVAYPGGVDVVAHYLDLAASGRIDLTGMLTHTFRLEEWRSAFDALADQGRSGAIKVAFDLRG